MISKSDRALYTPLTLAGAVLVLFGYFAVRGALGQGATDQPPSISFDWIGEGEPTTLWDFKGKLVMKDDRGLDFTAYRMDIKETGKSYDLPIPGLSGKQYEQDIYLSWLNGNAALAAAKKATITFTIKDDAGHEAMLTKEIPLK